MESEASEQKNFCRECMTEIPNLARVCAICNSYQDWRRFVPFSNTAMALLTALVSVIGLATPAVYKVIHTPHSDAYLTMPSIDGTTLRIVAVNQGDAPASLVRAWVDSDYLAAATKIRLRNDSDAILPPGSRLISFDIIPLLDEDDSYRSSLEMLALIYKDKPAPRTEIHFKVFQSDGRYAIQAVSLDAGELFHLLRNNSDRCSAVKEINFENGCIGRGTPPEERFPQKSDNLAKGLADELERRINSQEAAAKLNSERQ
jgi:hypothetical protein